MDFNFVKRQIIKEYIAIYGNDRKGDIWSLESCIEVFEYYFSQYKAVFGEDHPNISNKTVNSIIQSLPYLNKDSSSYDLTPEDYPVMIDSYFEQAFYNCNYSISHFMSGDIRNLRYYETLY